MPVTPLSSLVLPPNWTYTDDTLRARAISRALFSKLPDVDKRMKTSQFIRGGQLRSPFSPPTVNTRLGMTAISSFRIPSYEKCGKDQVGDVIASLICNVGRTNAEHSCISNALLNQRSSCRSQIVRKRMRVNMEVDPFRHERLGRRSFNRYHCSKPGGPILVAHSTGHPPTMSALLSNDGRSRSRGIAITSTSRLGRE